MAFTLMKCFSDLLLQLFNTIFSHHNTKEQDRRCTYRYSWQTDQGCNSFLPFARRGPHIEAVPRPYNQGPRLVKE